MTKSRGVGRGFGGGRPTSYKPEYATEVINYCLLGAKDSELAEVFGVCEDTLNLWKQTHPSFSASIKKGREMADGKVVRSLYSRAIGGDVTACIFWLKNRQPTRWRDVQDRRLSGTVTLAALVAGEDSPAVKPVRQIEAAAVEGEE